MTSSLSASTPLSQTAPQIARLLRRNVLLRPARFDVPEIRCATRMITMRDGVRLATDIYLPPTQSAPTIAVRTPYSRGQDRYAGAFMSFARRGYAVVAQDCRGTGGSEPDHWDYYVFEQEDGYDLAEWITQQSWFNGFIGACGGSYVGQTQWPMALHPAMSTIVPEVSGLGFAINTLHIYMFVNAYAYTIGKGVSQKDLHITEMESAFATETLSGGLFNDPLVRPFPEYLQRTYPELAGLTVPEAQKRLWALYSNMGSADRAKFIKDTLGVSAISAMHVEHLSTVFGQTISHDAHTIPFADKSKLCRALKAPALIRTGWYDWGLNDALETWRIDRAPTRRPGARLVHRRLHC